MPRPRQGWLPLFVVGVLWTCGGATCMRSINTPPLRPGATLQEAVDVSAAQTAYLTNLSMPQARLSGNADGTSFPSVSSRIAVAPPLNLRLVAETPFTGKEVDLGSNDQLFWFWVKRNQPPATYFCRHDRFAQSPVRSKIALEPSWVLESMGFGVYRPDDRPVDLRPAGPGRLAIRLLRQDPLGTMQKVVVIDERVGWILEQHLFDPQMQLVARTLAKDHQKDPVTGAIVPGKLEIYWAQAKLQLNVGMGQILFNESMGDPQTLWSLPQIPDYPVVDLAEIGRERERGGQ